MFAKGPMPGYSPKTEYLKQRPGAYCQRLWYGFWAYGVFETRDAIGPVLVRQNAVMAWDAALDKLPANNAISVELGSDLITQVLGPQRDPNTRL